MDLRRRFPSRVLLHARPEKHEDGLPYYRQSQKASSPET